MRPFVERDRNQVVDIFREPVLGIDAIKGLGDGLRLANGPQIHPGLGNIVLGEEGAADAAGRFDIRLFEFRLAILRNLIERGGTGGRQPHLEFLLEQQRVEQPVPVVVGFERANSSFTAAAGPWVRWASSILANSESLMSVTTAVGTASGAATSRTAAVAAFHGHQPVGPDRLHFDDAQSGGGRLQGQPRAFRPAIVQHIENQLGMIERPFQIDQFQLQLPIPDAGLP